MPDGDHWGESSLSIVSTPDKTHTHMEASADVLALLEDAVCRSILSATRTPATAGEIAHACNLPLSTTYRKLDQLEEAAFLEESTRPQRRGKHPQQYQRLADVFSIHVSCSRTCDIDVVVSMDA